LREEGRKLGDGFEQKFGFGSAKALFGGEGAKHGHGADSRATSHFEVLGRIANVDAGARLEREMAEREPQRLGVRFLAERIAAANAGREEIEEAKLAELPEYAVAVSAGDKAEAVAFRYVRENAARAGDELRAMPGVLLAPGRVRIAPAVTGQARRAIDAIPIRRIVGSEFVESPGDAHFPEHGEIRGGISGKGIDEGAVPIEEHALQS